MATFDDDIGPVGSKPVTFDYQPDIGPAGSTPVTFDYNTKPVGSKPVTFDYNPDGKPSGSQVVTFNYKAPTTTLSTKNDVFDPKIEHYQKFMETSPLGIVYNNPAKKYGFLDQQLISALMLLETKLAELTGNHSIKGRLVYGNGINFNTTPQQLKLFIDKVSKENISKTNSKVIDFKKYLKSIGMYDGDVNSDQADHQFIGALQKIERDIAKAIGNDSVIGLIWQGNGINAQTSPEDIQNALSLIKQKKTAQSLDTFEVNQDANPIATKTVPTQDDMGLEVGDPIMSQQIGKSYNKVPKSVERLELLKMLAK